MQQYPVDRVQPQPPPHCASPPHCGTIHYEAMDDLGWPVSVTRLAIRFHHWPINSIGGHSGHPHYTVSEEQDVKAFWRESLVHKVDGPLSHLPKLTRVSNYAAP
eukprot:203665-Prymnesium_polylepis.1